MNDDAIARFTDEDGDDNALPLEFATATMGHVLLGQGRPDEARAVFAAVLAKDPLDASALRGMGLIGGGSGKDGVTEALAPQAYVRAIGMSPTALMVHFSAPLSAVSHLTARPDDAPLVLTVSSFRAGSVGVLTSHQTVSLSAREGERAVHGLEPSATHLVALAACVGDRVVPFARAQAVTTPTDAPQPYGRALAAEVAAAGPADEPAAESPLALSVEVAHARWAAGVESS